MRAIQSKESKESTSMQVTVFCDALSDKLSSSSIYQYSVTHCCGLELISCLPTKED